MQQDRQIPVLVGVGQLRNNRDRTISGAREPLELMLEALTMAAADAGSARLLTDADSIDAVNVVSWSYADLPGLLASRLGARPTHSFCSPLGGQWPARLLDQAAARIAEGQTQIAVIVGGEAHASTGVLTKAGVDPVAERGWSAQPGGPAALDPELLGTPAAQAAGLVLPTRVYPLFENRLRYELGQTPEQALAWSAQLYSDFSRVAEQNPAAWNPLARSASDLATVGPDNRMVCEPYPLSMNAMPLVDQAAAVILTSLATAREYGVAEDQLVYLWGGAGAEQAVDFLHRDGFGSSPALSSALDRTLAGAGVAAEQLDIVDIYSCFPIVPKLACLHLGLPEGAVPSVTGGHSSFGGPLNTYTLFAAVAITQRLRTTAGLALLHGNGGFLSYQHAVLLSNAPHPEGYRGRPEPLSIVSAEAPEVVAPTDGEVVIETATVEYGRDNQPAVGFVVGRTVAGQRVAAQTAHGDLASAQVLSLQRANDEVVGRTVRLDVTDAHVRITRTEPQEK